MKNSIKKRALKILNLKTLNRKNKPEFVKGIDLDVPKDEVYILRMLIKTSFSDILIPKEYDWIRPIVEEAYLNQLKLNISQPYCYVTIRSGEVKSTLDDEFHLDGFSMRVTHIPEQNYIWCDNLPTEYIVKPIKVNKKFSPFKHNIHLYIQDKITKKDVISYILTNCLYAIDTYVIHRRQKITEPTNRCFIRISFTPIEINDINNTQNPLLPTNYTQDGVSFRNTLKRFKIK